MPNRGAHILYVDDDQGLCRLAQRRLERLGFVVTIAHDGAEAVARVRDGAFDLVALDHYMPGQDGETTLRELMAMPHPPAVIYVTGAQETSIAVNALKAGAADYVVKAASDDFFDLLGRTINQALDARRILGEKERAEQSLRETNAVLEAMLVEMNHRVANSLQMVASLVSLQARRATGGEAQMILQDIRRRIDAVARVHRQLYVAGGKSRIAMADYVHALGRDLAASFALDGSQRRILVDAEPFDLPTAEAIGLGILINELVSNACKYAYAEDESGDVRVTLTTAGSNAFSLVVEDDGRGASLDGDTGVVVKGTGIGSQMIRAIADTLGATIVTEPSASGYRTRITRPSQT